MHVGEYACAVQETGSRHALELVWFARRWVSVSHGTSAHSRPLLLYHELFASGQDHGKTAETIVNCARRAHGCTCYTARSQVTPSPTLPRVNAILSCTTTDPCPSLLVLGSASPQGVPGTHGRKGAVRGSEG